MCKLLQIVTEMQRGMVCGDHMKDASGSISPVETADSTALEPVDDGHVRVRVTVYASERRLRGGAGCGCVEVPVDCDRSSSVQVKSKGLCSSGEFASGFIRWLLGCMGTSVVVNSVSCDSILVRCTA